MNETEKEVCIIRVEMDEAIRPHFAPELEDTVKQAWGYLTPWFTARHGVRSGEITLNGGAVRFSWEYTFERGEHRQHSPAKDD